MDVLHDFVTTLLLTGRDLLPIMLLFAFFQIFVIRKPVANLQRIIVGSGYVFIGLTFFLTGLEDALFPLGKIMADQLTNPVFLQGDAPAIDLTDWKVYGWMYFFAAAIGFATTVAEPSLIAVASKAQEVSGGSISQWGLRITVAIGVAFGLSLGTFRIISGTPLYLYIMAGYLVVIEQQDPQGKNI